MDHFETHTYDVLVVGAGGAGLRAAIDAAAQGASVGLICKSLLGKAHTVMAEGGVAAALANTDGRDSWQVHFRDTMRGGKMLNDWRMAELLAREAPARVAELEGWGALFDRTPDGRILQRNFGGHQYPRLAHVGDRTGLEMIRTLQDKTVHSPGVDVYMECTVDGLALAYEAGADLMGMEFVQFHPTGMVWPLSVRGILVTEGVRGEGGVLKNSKGERFMFRYIPEMFKKDFADSEAEANRWVEEVIAGRKAEARRPPELLTRDVVARAIAQEVREGRGSPHGGAFLDIASRRRPEDIRKKLPSMYQQFHELADVDITRDAMEVGPTTHYVMGGVRVDPESQAATVPGLFAAGEVGGGLHGANRLGGNSLSDLLVFGRRAGMGAAAYAKAFRGEPRVETAEVEAAAAELLAPFERTGGGENPYAVQEALQDMMGTYVGIARKEDDLRTALAELEQLRARAARVVIEGNRQYNPGWNTAIDLKNLLIVSEAVTRAALERRESRGAHMRVEYPDSDKHFGTVDVIVRRQGERMTVGQEPIPPLPDELRRVVEGEV